MPVGQFYDVTWGAARLWCGRISTTGGRTQVVHELAEGDDHPVQDRGLAVRRVTCEILFVEMPREATPPLERFLAFKRQVDDGERLLFTHPIDGQFYVNVEGFDYDLDEDGNVVGATAVFIRSADAEGPTPAGSGTQPAAGEDAVAASAAEHTTELEAVGMTSDIGERAVAAQESWGDATTVPTRQVIVDVASLSDEISVLLEDLETDLALFAAYKATIFLAASIRAAALAALAETPKVTAIRIGGTVSLLALCVRIYGGSDANDRVRQILALNDIRTPAWLTPGSVIVIPVPSAARRARAA